MSQKSVSVDELRRKGVPPSDSQLECDCLGAVFFDPSAFPLLAKIGEDAFTDKDRQAIYRAAVKAFNRGLPPDVGTVADILRETLPQERADQLRDLCESWKLFTAAQLPLWVKRLGILQRQRRLIRLGDAATKAGYQNADPDEWADQLESSARELRDETALDVDFFESEDSQAFFATEDAIEYLSDDFLPKAQNCVMGAREKVGKTSCAGEIAVCLDQGLPVFGVFTVPKPVKVGFVSGEAGRAVTKKLIRRVCDSKGVDPASLSIRWSTKLPCLEDPKQLGAIEPFINRFELDALFLDCFYLMQGLRTATHSTNINVQGALLKPLNDIITRTGCSIIMLHHLRRGTGIDDPHEMPDLKQLSQAGMTEWAASWILMARQEAYHPDKPARLWMNVGGRAGHASQWSVTIDEGPQGNRHWRTHIEPARNVLSKKQFDQAEAIAKSIKEMMERTKEIEWWTTKMIAGQLGGRQTKFRPSIDFLLDKGLMESRETTKGGGTLEYRIKPGDALTNGKGNLVALYGAG